MRLRNPVLWRAAVGVLGTSCLGPGLVAQKEGGTPPEVVKPGDTPPMPSRIGLEPPPGTILSPGEAPIDLPTALKLAKAENPELLRARERVTETLALRQFAAAQLLPNLNLGTNYDLHSGPLQQSNGNILSVNRSSLYYGLGANAVAAGTVNIPGLSYTLNVGDSWYGYLAARQRTRTAAATADAVRNDVLLRVCQAYLELLRAEGRRAIANRNRQEGAETARATKAYAKVGQGSKADDDRATVELRRRDAQLVQAEADILIASARLCRLLNLDPSTRLKPIDGWVVPVALVPDPVPLADLVAIALLQRPELAARRSEVRTALYELSRAKILPFSPNVILGFSAGDFGGGSSLVSTPQGFYSPNGQLLSGPRFGDFAGRTDLDVAVFWTLRNMGIGNLALIRAADSRMRQMRLRELETLNTVRAQVAEAHAQVAAQFLQIEEAEKAVRASGLAYGQDVKRVQGGLGVPLEAVDSMRLLARSRYEYLDAIVDYNQAQFQLWVALGRPPAGVLARPVPVESVPPVELNVRPDPPNPGPRALPLPAPMKP